MSRPRGLAVVAFAAVVGMLGTAGCSSAGTDAEPRGECPVAPVRVVVTVDQWGDIAEQLAGDCADVTTIIAGSGGDPHEFEPPPSDNATFGRADLVVVNGLGYDSWADSRAGHGVASARRGGRRRCGRSVGTATTRTSGTTPPRSSRCRRRSPRRWARPPRTLASTSRERAAAWSPSSSPTWRRSPRPRRQGAGTLLRRHRVGVRRHGPCRRASPTLTPAGYRSAAATGVRPLPGRRQRLRGRARARVGRPCSSTTPRPRASVPDRLRDVADRAGSPGRRGDRVRPAGVVAPSSPGSSTSCAPSPPHWVADGHPAVPARPAVGRRRPSAGGRLPVRRAWHEARADDLGARRLRDSPGCAGRGHRPQRLGQDDAAAGDARSAARLVGHRRGAR